MTLAHSKATKLKSWEQGRIQTVEIAAAATVRFLYYTVSYITRELLKKTFEIHFEGVSLLSQGA